MAILIPKSSELEISEVVAGLLARRELHWAMRGVNAKFTQRDRALVERAMMDHRNAAADTVLGAAVYVVTQIEKPWLEKAQRWDHARTLRAGGTA